MEKDRKTELEKVYKQLIVICDVMEYIAINYLKINNLDVYPIKNALELSFDIKNLKGLKQFEKEILNAWLIDDNLTHKKLFFNELEKRLGVTVLNEVLQKVSFRPLIDKVLKRGLIKNRKESEIVEFILDEYFEVLTENERQKFNALILDYSNRIYR